MCSWAGHAEHLAHKFNHVEKASSKPLLPGGSPLLCPTSPSLLQVYGKNTVFDADRLIDLLVAFESFTESAKSARGNLDLDPDYASAVLALPGAPSSAAALATSTVASGNGSSSPSLLPLPAGFPLPAGLGSMGPLAGAAAPLLSLGPVAGLLGAGGTVGDDSDARTREALRYWGQPGVLLLGFEMHARRSYCAVGYCSEEVAVGPCKQDFTCALGLAALLNHP